MADTESTDTMSELRAAARLFKAQRISRIVLVSSPTHLPRCLRDAPAALAAEGMWPLPHGGVLLAVPSETSYAGCTAADTCIVEPPHRGDRDRRLEGSLALHRLAARALQVPPGRREQFAAELDRLLSSHGT